MQGSWGGCFRECRGGQGHQFNHQDTKITKNHQEMIFALAPWRQSKILLVHLCVLCVLVVNLFSLPCQPAVVAEGDEGVGLDPVEEEEGKVGIKDAVDEIQVPFLVDIVEHIDQGDDA